MRHTGAPAGPSVTDATDRSSSSPSRHWPTDGRCTGDQRRPRDSFPRRGPLRSCNEALPTIGRSMHFGATGLRSFRVNDHSSDWTSAENFDRSSV